MDRRAYGLILIIAIIGAGINAYMEHYKGGEIYEAANKAYGLVRKGFNVTVTVEDVNGTIITGEMFSVYGSTIYIVKDGRRISIGGPSARFEEVKARRLEVHARGKVFVYELPPVEGPFEEAIRPYLVPSYSERFSGLIYVKGGFNAVDFGKLKYDVDYLTYGSIDLKQSLGDGVVLSAGMVPLDMLEKYLKGREVYMYGTLYVNSEEQNLDLHLIEVREQ